MSIDQGFERVITDVSGRNQLKPSRYAVQNVGLNEIIVLRHNKPAFQVSVGNQRLVRRGVSRGQVKGMNRVEPAIVQPSRQTPR